MGYFSQAPKCHRCNWLKGAWDANTKGEIRYVKGTCEITQEDHDELLCRARVYVRRRMQERENEFRSTRDVWLKKLGAHG